MKDMINKELLSEVLNKDVISFDFSMYGNINYKVNNDYGSSINIYDFVYRCKIWGLSKGFIIIEYPNLVTIHKDGDVKIYEKFTDVLSAHYLQDRVVKACEYILKEIKK